MSQYLHLRLSLYRAAGEGGQASGGFGVIALLAGASSPRCRNKHSSLKTVAEAGFHVGSVW